jgi:hypothetical protein
MLTYNKGVTDTESFQVNYVSSISEIGMNGDYNQMYPWGMLPRHMFNEVKRMFVAESDKQSELYDVTPGQFFSNKFSFALDLRHSENNNLIGSGIAYDGTKDKLSFKINRTGVPSTQTAPQVPQFKITVFAIYMVKQWFFKLEGTNLFDINKDKNKEY